MSDGDKKIILAKCAEAEFEEKKSVFIGYAAPVSNEDEAKKIINERKSAYGDATHNVWAYYIDKGARARCSDDGEPQGTAGMPVLNVLKMSGGTDMCVVVTRYFGGTLLGAGGLVRAYSAAAKAAIDAAGLAECRMYDIYEIPVSYSDYQRLTVQLAAVGAIEESADFGSEVTVKASVERDNAPRLISLVSDLTGGKSSAVLVGSEERAAVIQ